MALRVFYSLVLILSSTQTLGILAINDVDWSLDDYSEFDEEIEKEIQCAPPPKLANGETVVWGDGLLLEYLCKEGYFAVGITHGACDLSTGTWTIDVPVCVDQGCPPLTAPRHGVVNIDNSGGLATLLCRPGYFLLGDSTLVCEEGRWKGVYPMCVVIAKRNKKTKSRKVQRMKKLNVTGGNSGLTFEQSDESCFFHQIHPPEIKHAVVDTSYFFNEVRHRYVMVAIYRCMGGFVLMNGDANKLFCKNKIWGAPLVPECVPEDDPCEKDNAGCHHYCTPQSRNHYSCSCYEGYNLGSDAKRCKDVDECAIDNGNCEQECFNTDGSFFCSCQDGYSPKGPKCIETVGE